MSRRPVHPLFPTTPASERLTSGLALAGIAGLAAIIISSVDPARSGEPSPTPPSETVGQDVFVQADDESHYYGPAPTVVPSPGQVAGYLVDNRPSADEVVAGAADLGSSLVDNVSGSVNEVMSEVGR